MAGELASGWALSAVMDKKRKRAGPFGLALFRLGSLGPPLSVLLHYTTLCSCCQQHFGDGRCFRWLLRPCCLRASPRGAPPPTGGRGVGSCWLCCPTGHNAARSVRRGRHSGGPSAFTLVARGAAALSARVGFPLPDDFGRLWGFCGCRRDWAEPIGAARRSRGDARDKKGLDKIGGVWYGVGCQEHFAKSMFSEIQGRRCYDFGVLHGLCHLHFLTQFCRI